MDDVTASFAASLALATNEVVDLSRSANSAARRGSQAYLLARPLAAKPAPLQDLRRFFRRVWVLEKDFKIQERPENRFVIAFDLKRDRNKVLRGGPWRFNQAPVVMQEYDGIAPPQSVALDALFFRVRITNIPPLFEDKDTIRDIAAIAGKVIELDNNLFDATGKIRVRVSHALSKPFFLKKQVKLAPGVEEEIGFFFENLVGKCNYCDLIFHGNGICPAIDGRTLPRMDVNPMQRKLEIKGPSMSFAQSQFANGLFQFQGLQTPVLPSIARSLFHQKEQGGRRPVILRGLDNRSSSSKEEEDTTLALVPIEETTSSKRDRQPSDYQSPKKLKVILPELFNQVGSAEAPTKKLKMPEFSSKFNARSLGLIEAPGSILVPTSERDVYRLAFNK
ncbi:uncharacterized protein LOC133733938 [Rosa rugosa]|uniref:uncharacterized protein LOC133733938 n=1 Tax=Rosa rugosa TaxID=74645 RepID=UPI002B417142|nr:uncharacterized protein LOC133733938 [Rosa rugosa]